MFIAGRGVRHRRKFRRFKKTREKSDTKDETGKMMHLP